MMTLRCTRRLMDYLDTGFAAGLACGETQPLLGDWYVNLLRHRRAALALCVNEKTRYAIVIPLKSCETILQLYIRLAQRIYDAMRRLGIADEVARRVLDQHRGGVCVAPTASRSVLGTMNDLAKAVTWYLDGQPRHVLPDDLSDLDRDLNMVPHRPLGWANATDRLIELCAGRWTTEAGSVRTARWRSTDSQHEDG
jgi:hypothetical protein